jgi:phosphoglycerol transferase
MIRRRIKTYTRISAYWLAFVLLFTSSWLGRKFGHPNFEQVLYHLQFGSTGLIDVDQGLIWSYIRQCLLAPLIPTLLIYALEKAVIQIREIGFKAYRTKVTAKAKQVLARAGLMLERIGFQLFRRRLPFFLIILASAVLLSQLSVWSYLRSLQYMEFFSANYVSPSAIQAPRQKRNLLLIYAESMEQTYAERGIFGSNLIEGLTINGMPSQSVDRFIQTPGTGWTIAGIVASQCGVPLRPVTMNDGNRSNEEIKA